MSSNGPDLTEDEREIIEGEISERDAEQVSDWRRVDPDQSLASFDNDVLVQWQDSADRIAVYVERGEHSRGDNEGEPYYEAGTTTIDSGIGYESKSLVSYEDLLETALDSAVDYLKRTEPDEAFPVFSLRIEGGIIKPLANLLRRFGAGKARFSVSQSGIYVESVSFARGIDFTIAPSDTEAFEVEQEGELTIDTDAFWEKFGNIKYSDTVPISFDGDDERPKLGIGPTSMKVSLGIDYIEREFPEPEPFDFQFTADGLNFEAISEVVSAKTFDTVAIGVQDGVPLIYAESSDEAETVTARFDATDVRGTGMVTVDNSAISDLRRATPRFSQTDVTFTAKFDNPLLAEVRVGQTDVDVRMILANEAIPIDISIPEAEIMPPEEIEEMADREGNITVVSGNRPLTRQARRALKDFGIVEERSVREAGRQTEVELVERPTEDVLEEHELFVDEEPIEVWEGPGGEEVRIFPTVVISEGVELSLSPAEAAEKAREQERFTPADVPDDSQFGPVEAEPDDGDELDDALEEFASEARSEPEGEHEITQIIREELGEWECDPETVNEGECSEFAQAVFDQIEGARIVHNLEFAGQVAERDLGPAAEHVWLELDGVFYDAEMPEGVDDWKELPFFQRFFDDGVLDDAFIHYGKDSGQVYHPDIRPLKEGEEPDESTDDPDEPDPPEPDEPEEERATILVSLIGGSKNYNVPGQLPGAIQDEAISAARDTLGPPGQFDVNDEVGSVAFRRAEVTGITLNPGRSLLAEETEEEPDEEEPEEPPENFGRTIEGTFSDEVIEAGEVEEEVVPPEEPEDEPDEEAGLGLGQQPEEPEFTQSEIETVVEQATLGVQATAAIGAGGLEKIHMRLLDNAPVTFQTTFDEVEVEAVNGAGDTIISAIETWNDIVELESLSDEEVEEANSKRDALQEQFGVVIPKITFTVPPPVDEMDEDVEVAAGFTGEEIETIIERATIGLTADVSVNEAADSLRIALEKDVSADAAYRGSVEEVQGQASNPGGAIRRALEIWDDAIDKATLDVGVVNRSRSRLNNEFDITLPQMELPEALQEEVTPERDIVTKWNTLMEDLETVAIDEDNLVLQSETPIPVEVEQDFATFADEEEKTQIEEGLQIHHTEEVHEGVHEFVARLLGSEPENFYDSSKPSDLPGYDLYYSFTLSRNTAPGEWTNPRFAPSTLINILEPIDSSEILVVARGAPLS